MRVAYVGSHDPMTARGTPWTTETAWAASLELLGHEVVRIDERTTSWGQRVEAAATCDMFLITSTWGQEERQPRGEGSRAIQYLNDRMPTAMIHLDRWWGLSNREHQLRESPQFRVRWCFTADGDNQDQFAALGIRHRWLPPGVYEPECVPGVARDEWRADVAFIGNWRGYGHAEHADYRNVMLATLNVRFYGRTAFWPRDDQPSPWGLDYNDLLASVKVIVGDSWRGANRYWSNRVFEVVGRGGFCVHPAVPGLVELLPEGMGVAYFPPGDWDAMCAVIDRWVARDDRRSEAAAQGQAFVREHHTYTHRLRDALAIMDSEGAWS